MPDAANPPESALPYREMTDPEYARKAAAFQVVQIRGGILLSGPCPRCADPMTFEHYDKIFKFMGTGIATSNADSSKLPMLCTCRGQQHPGRPEGAHGCGAYWNLTVEASNS